jgi:hypothetical protein
MLLVTASIHCVFVLKLKIVRSLLLRASPVKLMYKYIM